MTTNNALKTLTLFGFCILLLSFVAFKAGVFDKYLTTDSDTSPLIHNGQIVNVEAGPWDTIPVLRVDSISPTMLPTSKSLILIDQKIKVLHLDSTKSDGIKQSLKK